jgi:hypothetical protein
LVDLFETVEVIFCSAFHGRVGVFADVDSKDTFEVMVAHTLHEEIHTFVVKAEAVDQCLLFGEPENPRLGVAWLGAGRYGTDLYKAETQIAQCFKVLGVFVQAGSDAHRVGEFQPHALNRSPGHGTSPARFYQLVAQAQALQCQ